MKKLWHFHWDCGRMGDLTSVFLATQEEVDAVVGEYIYFGEVLGKHSEIHGDIEENDIQLLTDDQAVCLKLAEVIDGNTLSGNNPLDYYEGKNG
jgi:hypothetical protein